MVEELSLINEILEKSGMELDFIGKYLARHLEAKRILHNDFTLKLTSAENKRYSEYAGQGLRCNILLNLTNYSCRELSKIIAGSEFYQTFLFAGDISRLDVPGKTKINDFSKMISGDELKKMLSESMRKVKKSPEICETVSTDVIWADCTCLLSNIHFPVDWILLRDAVRSTVKTIETLRKHGIIHRIKPPRLFLTEINKLCIEMSNTRRRPNSRKMRKKVLRKMKQLVKLVKGHAENYRNKLLNDSCKNTDLSGKQISQFLGRLNKITELIPKAEKQAHERIISGKKIKSDGKILSFYDDSVCVVPRGKAGSEIEFGNELLIAEQRDGFIMGWKLYKKKTNDTKKVSDILNIFSGEEYGVKALVTDRGFSSKTNSKKLEKKEIMDCILPKNTAAMKEAMKNTEYRRLQKRRSQTETRIAIIKQFIGDRLKSREFEYKEMKVGWAVITHNLVLLAKIMRENRGKIPNAA
jgi:hypothetical protein